MCSRVVLWIGLLSVAVGAGCARRADNSSSHATLAARPAPAVVADLDTRGVVAAGEAGATAGEGAELVPAGFLEAVRAGQYGEALKIYRRAGRPRLPAAVVNEVLWKTATTMHELSEQRWVKEDGRWTDIARQSTPEDKRRWARFEAKLDQVMPDLLRLVEECCPFMTYEVDEEYRALPIVEAKILRVNPKKFPAGLDEAAVVAWGLARGKLLYFEEVDGGVAVFSLCKGEDFEERRETSLNEFEKLFYRRLGLDVRKKAVRKKIDDIRAVWCPMAGREGMVVVGEPFYAFYDLKEGRKMGDLPVPAKWRREYITCVKDRVLVVRDAGDGRGLVVYELEWTGAGFRPVERGR